MPYVLTNEDRERATAALVESYAKDGYDDKVWARIETPITGADLVARAAKILADAGKSTWTEAEYADALVQAEKERGDAEFVGVTGLPVTAETIASAAWALADRCGGSEEEWQVRIRRRFASGAAA